MVVLEELPRLTVRIRHVTEKTVHVKESFDDDARFRRRVSRAKPPVAAPKVFDLHIGHAQLPDVLEDPVSLAR